MKAELKKEKNRNLLMESAYKLFTEEGFHKTTIASIAKNAGLGKGTFYLYFKDKEDIRDSLIIFKSSKLLHDAIDNSDLSESGMTFYDRLIVIADYMLNRLTADKKLLKFIYKSLSWGLFLRSGDYDNDSQDIMNIEEFVNGLIKKSQVKLKDQKLFIYTIIELISSTCYGVIIDGEPTSLNEYKPFLYRAIKLITDDQVISE